MINLGRRVTLRFLFVVSLASVTLTYSGCDGKGDSVETDLKKKSASKSVAAKSKKKGPAFSFNGTKTSSRGTATKSNFSPKVKFNEVDQKTGLNFVYQNGETGYSLMVETTGGGSGWLDYDLDGVQDVYMTQGGDPESPPGPTQPNDEIFRQLDNGNFVAVAYLTSIAEHGYSQGAATGDFDGDGFINLADFRQILTYKPGEDKDQVIEGDQPIE